MKAGFCFVLRTCLQTLKVGQRDVGAVGGASAVGLAVDVVHVHFEVVGPGELLVAELALGQRAVGVVGHLVPDQHLLQAEGQVAHLEDTQRHGSPGTEKPTGRSSSPGYRASGRSCCEDGPTGDAAPKTGGLEQPAQGGGELITAPESYLPFTRVLCTAHPPTVCIHLEETTPKNDVFLPVTD